MCLGFGASHGTGGEHILHIIFTYFVFDELQLSMPFTEDNLKNVRESVEWIRSQRSRVEALRIENEQKDRTITILREQLGQAINQVSALTVYKEDYDRLVEEVKQLRTVNADSKVRRDMRVCRVQTLHKGNS